MDDGTHRWPLVDHLLARAESTAPAFTWHDRDRPAHTLTWSELARAVAALSGRLRETARPGERVAVLGRQDLGYVTGFLATLHAGLIAVPLGAPDSRTQRARLAAALSDSTPSVWVTSERSVAAIRAFADEAGVPEPRRILTAEEGGGAAPPADVGLADPAYLQYTSGSTRDPAAAVISHGALAASVEQVATAYAVRPDTTCAGWIPFTHDMGLIQLLCVPVYTGARSAFLEPLEFIRSPRQWLELLSGYPDVFTAAPNFAFDFAVETVPAAHRAGLDLSGVRVALNGSEPVRPATIAAFAEAYAPYGFDPAAHRPSYGLAEATVYVSSTGPEGPTITAFDRSRLAAGRAVPVPGDSPGAVRLVAAGRPVGQHVRIVHPDTCRPEPDGTVGEIWVHGPHLASGYWRQPDRTQETFAAHLAPARDDISPAKCSWLRTGDLGVFYGGLLYVTGRRKDIVIVDGHNHYPQDIEATVADADPVIRRDRVAAFAVAGDGGEGVMVVAEPARGTELADVEHARVARTVRRAIAEEHDITLSEFRLVPPGELPRTSSGKVARAAARARFGPAG